jgi:hypothetical protein
MSSVISAPVEVETMQQITQSDATIFIKVDCRIEDVYIEGIGFLFLVGWASSKRLDIGVNLDYMLRWFKLTTEYEYVNWVV